MKEYIDKAVLIAMCKGIAAFDWNKKVAPVSWADAYERFADEVEDFDAADVVERKRGGWEVHPRDTFAREHKCEKLRCSSCWHFFYRNYGDSKLFCPNCGADMRSHHDSLCDQTEGGRA